MADQPKKVSAEPVATSIGENDRVVVLYNANTAAPSLRTITANNFLNSTIFANLSVYADNNAALANSAAVGSCYKTATGELRVVV